MKKLSKCIVIDLIGVIDEQDYIRYSQKFANERKKIEENIKNLKSKIRMLVFDKKKEIDNKEVQRISKNFLEASYINQEILFEIVERIEVDENKKVYIHFNFEQLNNFVEGQEIKNACIS